MNDKVTDKRPQFFMVEDAVVSNYELDPYSGWLYIVILKHADRRTGEAFPSITRLTELSKMSRAQVMRSIAILEEKKLIRVERDPIPLEGEKRQRKPNHYFILPATDNPQVVSGRDYPSISQQLGVVSGVDCNHNPIEPESTNHIPPNPRKRGNKGRASKGDVYTTFEQLPIASTLYDLFSGGVVPAQNQLQAALMDYVKAAQELTAKGETAERVKRAYCNMQRFATEQDWTKGFGLSAFMKRYVEMVDKYPNVPAAPAKALDLSEWTAESVWGWSAES